MIKVEGFETLGLGNAEAVGLAIDGRGDEKFLIARRLMYWQVYL